MDEDNDSSKDLGAAQTTNTSLVATVVPADFRSSGRTTSSSGTRGKTRRASAPASVLAAQLNEFARLGGSDRKLTTSTGGTTTKPRRASVTRNTNRGLRRHSVLGVPEGLNLAAICETSDSSMNYNASNHTTGTSTRGLRGSKAPERKEGKMRRVSDGSISTVGAVHVDGAEEEDANSSAGASRRRLSVKTLKGLHNNQGVGVAVPMDDSSSSEQPSSGPKTNKELWNDSFTVDTTTTGASDEPTSGSLSFTDKENFDSGSGTRVAEPLRLSQQNNAPSPSSIYERGLTSMVPSYRQMQATPMADESMRSEAFSMRSQSEAYMLDVSCELLPDSALLNSSNSTSQEKSLLTTGAMILFVILIVAVVVPVVTMGGENDDPQDQGSTLFTPSQPSSTTGMDTALIPGIEESTWAAIAADPESPQSKAYSWILEDPLLDTYEGWQSQQRFALAAFYYAMNGEKWGETAWLDHATDECEWSADPLTCDEGGHIRHLKVPQQRGFKGALPPELSLLTNLEGLDFSNNLIGGDLKGLLGNVFDHPSLEIFSCSKCRLSGSLPNEIFLMPNLRGIILNENEITGTLPPGIGRLTSLTALELINNELSGSIPISIGRLQQLKVLKLRDNGLDHELPTAVGSLSSLVHLDLGGTGSAGSMPSELGLLNNLEILELDRCSFSGTIPSELGLLAKLNELDLQGNGLSGTLPEELFLLSNMHVLYLQGNHFVGSIPASVGNLARMQIVDMTSNELRGTIPTEVGLMNALVSLELGSNQLTGSIPSELGGLQFLVRLTVESNTGIVGALPDGLCLGKVVELWTDWCEDEECCA